MIGSRIMNSAKMAHHATPNQSLNVRRGEEEYSKTQEWRIWKKAKEKMRRNGIRERHVNRILLGVSIMQLPTRLRGSYECFRHSSLGVHSQDVRRPSGIHKGKQLKRERRKK